MTSNNQIRFLVREIIKEAWSQHLDNVMDGGEDLPWNNEEPGSDPDDPNNPANIYNTANDSLSKVKPSVPGASQKAGVGRGSGPAGGGRVPGGKRV